jgi:hypothetical protein
MPRSVRGIDKATAHASAGKTVSPDAPIDTTLRFGIATLTEKIRVRAHSLICAALVAALPTAASADDPKDPGMRSAEARARDREMTRQLNLEELAKVRKRDAHSQSTRAARTRSSNAAGDEYIARSRAYDRAMSDYTQNRAQYEQEMADWRRAVAACRAGDHSACD